MKKSVDQYILSHPEWQNELLQLRGILGGLELEEGIKWGAPVYMIDGKNVVGLGAFKSYVGLWFFQGALLEDNDKVLVNAQEGRTKAMRQWRFKKLEDINKNLVVKYIKEAVENQKKGLVIKPSKSKTAKIPPELTDLLKGETKLKNAFYNLTGYKQKEYAEYIAEAKRASTKRSRLEKIAPMIRAGKGLNDKYR